MQLDHSQVHVCPRMHTYSALPEGGLWNVASERSTKYGGSGGGHNCSLSTYYILSSALRCLYQGCEWRQHCGPGQGRVPWGAGDAGRARKEWIRGD